MQIGDPFVRHACYSFQVLEGLRTGDFNELGLWPSREPAEVDEPSQETLIGQFMRWKDLVKKYAGVSKMLDPREMFLLAVAVQRWPGPVLEIGTHKGITTCFIAEVMHQLKRHDQIFTIEQFLKGWKAHNGEDGFPGDSYLKALQEFRSQAVLHRVVPIVGNSHELKPLIWGIRPVVIFLDGDHTRDGVADDLLLLRFFNHPYICIIHQANVGSVMQAVLDLRAGGRHRFANFHTGTAGDKGLVALTPV
jgi:hypothetical protein